MSVTTKQERHDRSYLENLYSEAEQLLRQGLTQKEVAERLNRTQAWVSVSIKRGRIKYDTGFERRLPWRMKTEHVNLSIPRGLRLAMRVQAGEEMPDYLRQQGEGFLRTLEETDTVIHYEPDVAPYFFRVPRREGIDNGLVREPVED